MLVSLSATHRRTPFETLERLSVTSEDFAGRLVESSEAVSGAVVVATCNRFEVYLELDDPVTSARAVALEATANEMHRSFGLDELELAELLDVRTGPEAVEHLFTVTAGLDSVVVGEGEIAGQVRRSLEGARTRGTTSPELERAFQHASQTNRGIRKTTALAHAGRSLVRLSLELAASRVEDWSTVRVLLVGTGSYARATLAALRDRGAVDIAVHSPSGNGARFALPRGLRDVPAAELAAELAQADLVITCTSSVQVIDRALFESGRLQHVARRQLVIDLGMPRNVNPDVRGLELLELLDLEIIRLHAPLEELNATEDAQQLVRRAVDEYADARAEQALAPAVSALRQHVHGVLEEEIARLRRRGGDPETEAAMRHLVGVLLHEPSVRARELAREGEPERFIDGVQALFGLEVERRDQRDERGPELRAV